MRTVVRGMDVAVKAEEGQGNLGGSVPLSSLPGPSSQDRLQPSSLSQKHLQGVPLAARETGQETDANCSASNSTLELGPSSCLEAKGLD